MTTGWSTRWVGRILLTVVVAVAGWLFAAGTAQAGGPTSVLLVSPSAQRTAALYYSDTEYERLNTLLGGYSPESDPAASAPSNGADYITVTWLIHDVSVWRIDRVFLGGHDEPLIVTQPVDTSVAGMYPGEAGDETAVVHRSPDPVALRGLLTSLGLVGIGAGRPDVGDAAAFETSPIDTAAITVRPVESSSSAPWWALAGLVVGVLLTAITVRLLPAVRRRLSDSASADQPPVPDDGPVLMTPLR